MTYPSSHTFVSLVLGCLVLTGCPEPVDPPLPPVADDIFAAMGEILPSATEEQRATFVRGEEVAQRRFTPEMGLGPSFNVTFCGACHEKPVFGGSAGRYRDFLLVEQIVSDGSRVALGVNGVLPQFNLETGRRPTDEGANHFGLRNPIPFFGIGLLAEIPEEAILANADPDDADGDGISGRPNIDRGFIGRFGRKAQTVTIEGFIRGPLGNHLGLTSNPLSDELRERLPVPSPRFEVDVRRFTDTIGSRHDAQASAPDEPISDSDGVPDPELLDQDLFDLVSWVMLLAPPTPDASTPAIEEGDALFRAANCTGCHVEGLPGPRGTIPAYSDLLLHDMGEGLADDFAFGEATGSEFRTQPLWGLSATGPYLHDGRADTIEEAIRAHGGEAARSRDAYVALSDAERSVLHEFLMSLGGRDQRTEGLIPPNTPIPSEGPGAARAPLSDEDSERFLEGRAIFDRDMFISEGLGPVFNGDSCRACHFDPVVGGSGPSGVDVIRHGRYDGDTFVAPAGGTVSHRHAVAIGRPAFADDTNIVERRQTPTVMGLGDLADIPESMILAQADPDDTNGDGIRGVAHVLPDGRLGRFGWKADVPNILEFVRDALSVELGLTLPEQDGATFGASEDGDSIADPEIDVISIDSLAFFITNLAPDHGESSDAPLEAMGAVVFEALACSGCHLNYTEEVAAYTDLLLHDVQADDYRGFPAANAGERMFRTPPLWGIVNTAPFMHNAAASTLEQAIAAHAGEASASTQAYGELSAEDREALLTFLRSI
ncbi:MAG: CxxC motif-containing protein (DUF1111 family) [Polyangiales bacterium]|jgi:CxxC motif-containing protein (DUF1111 family)